MPLVTLCERTCCDKVLLYMANKLMQFDLRQCVCSTYHDIQRWVGSEKHKHGTFCAEQGSQGRFLLSQK